MTKHIIKAQLLAFEKDFCDYTTYCFSVLDEKDKQLLKNNYVLCIRYPNWNAKNIKIGDVGILQFSEIRAGIDKWFNGDIMIPYNYNDWRFDKFILFPKEPCLDNNIVVD